jgi:hypothetical protein
MGTMASAHEMLRALKALGVIERMPTPAEQDQMAERSGGEPLWRLTCAHHLAGAVEAQVLMAGGAAVDAGCASTPVLQAGWEVYSGADLADDAARMGLLVAMARRLNDYVMVMTARKRRGDGDELLSPLVMTALPITGALTDLLTAAARETDADPDPRAMLSQVSDNLRAMADLLDSMTPAEHRRQTVQNSPHLDTRCCHSRPGGRRVDGPKP